MGIGQTPERNCAKLPNGESEMLIVKMLNGGLRVIMSLLSVGHPEIRFGNFEKIDNGGISKKTSIIRDNQGRLLFYKNARIAKILNEQSNPESLPNSKESARS